MAHLLKELRNILPDLVATPGVQWPITPAWRNPSCTVHLFVPGIKRNSSPWDDVVHALVEQRVYTDGSVERGSRSTTAAFTVPCLGHTWSARVSCSASSTTAELVALTEALAFLTTTRAGRSGPRFTFQRLALEYTTARVHLTLRQLNELESTIVFHAGIDGSTQDDKLAQTTHCQVTRIGVPPDPRHLGSNSSSWRRSTDCFWEKATNPSRSSSSLRPYPPDEASYNQRPHGPIDKEPHQ